MTTSTETPANSYRIGKVSKLTGITPDTLRVWERRYEAVTPQRSDTGGRLYSTEDISRLKLIKQLVDAGDAIGAIAGLDIEELQQRLAESHAIPASLAQNSRFRLVVIGEAMASKIRLAQPPLTAIELVASYPDISAFESETGKRDIEADIVVIEQATLQPETAIRIADWISRVHAARALVIYRFASRQTLERLPSNRTITMRAPVEPSSLEQQCIAIGNTGSTMPAEALLDTSMEPAPPRRYSDETLAKLASISSAIKCECPKHLAELLTSLTAFEQYSNECESRDSKDAELHTYLSTATSHARYTIENALSMVIEAENIDI